ncbi:FadR family transcriptional regulator [Aquibacillus sp. 3ASR75-11]|uniref:FadR family transcriptional regulator n=1 Tax=Terrihalobacillus insolitus TaxID=2950438 RepID=A0A9X3WSV5_9BACI|nr:FadR/GntR family transcriptional regulator [Terrihalobacillus insolitus]MDC3415130.1 FadR family transcriptional regulator [Terrihalobacillus insolitus]MDC3424038.1 FadR family transcriptional regulator [Terrihalobacillus insolitus]
MSPRNLSEQLLHDLGMEIVQGDLKPGDILPKVEAISEMKGVSRTVVREVLKGLSARRLIESSTKIGTMVKDRSEWQWWDQDVLSWGLNSGVTREMLLQLNEVRLAIEPAAVKLAAMNATDEDLKCIRECFKRLEDSLEDDAEWAKCDYEFHNSILVASHNELMLSLIKTLHSSLLQSRQTSIKSLKQTHHNTYTESNTEVIQWHKALMEAVCARDGGLAYQKMHDLLLRVGQLIENADS